MVRTTPGILSRSEKTVRRYVGGNTAGSLAAPKKRAGHDEPGSIQQGQEATAVRCTYPRGRGALPAIYSKAYGTVPTERLQASPSSGDRFVTLGCSM